jgi:hypothetical protein
VNSRIAPREREREREREKEGDGNGVNMKIKCNYNTTYITNTKQQGILHECDQLGNKIQIKSIQISTEN